MMPELGRSIAHDEGTALIREWIAAMPGGCQVINKPSLSLETRSNEHENNKNADEADPDRLRCGAGPARR